MRDRSRKVLEILEVDGYDITSGEILTHSLYEFTEDGEAADGSVLGALRMTGKLKNRGKLNRAGIKEMEK
jgi:pilus assembly protein CpaF